MKNNRLNFLKFYGLIELLIVILYFLFMKSDLYPDTYSRTYIFLVVFGIFIIGLFWMFNDEWTFTDKRRRDNEWYNDFNPKLFNFNLKLNTKIILSLTIIGVIYFISGLYYTGSNVYNSSIVLTRQYEQKVIQREIFYDKLWKTYLQKQKITDLNKETFIQVSKIIMENRKDGVNVTWKWVHENQNIPYSEFTSFYSDLSKFIETQREAYYNIEVECQTISMNHNMLLDTFPNNIYNKIIRRPHIKYDYGFLSDSTRKIFTTGNENLN